VADWFCPLAHEVRSVIDKPAHSIIKFISSRHSQQRVPLLTCSKLVVTKLICHGSTVDAQAVMRLTFVDLSST
jgi:hypothetical protein